MIYYIARFVQGKNVYKKVQRLIPDATEIIISPTLRFHQWKIAVMNTHQFFVGRSINKDVQILDQFNRVAIPETPVLDAAKQDENLSAFLSFSPVYRWEVDEFDDSYEVRFIDLGIGVKIIILL